MELFPDPLFLTAGRGVQEIGPAAVALGLITVSNRCKRIAASGDADMVALARGILYDPRRPWYTAVALGHRVQAPAQDRRSQPQSLRSLSDDG